MPSRIEILEERRLMAVTPPTVEARPLVEIQTVDSGAPVFRYAVGETSADNDGTGATATAVITQDTGSGAVEVFRRDYTIANRGSFSEEVFTNQFGIGTFILVVTANDAEYVGSTPQVTATAKITVRDDDSTAPTVTFDHPRTGQTDGDTTPLTWGYASDVATATLAVTRDGTSLYNGAAPASGSFNYGNVPGTYVATLTVTDNDNDRPGDSLTSTATKTFTVVDDDTTPPSAQFLYPRIDPITDADNIPFAWGTSVDVSLAHLVVTHTRPDGTTVTVADRDVSREGEFAIKPFGLGTFNATLVAHDDDNDRPGDSQSITITHQVMVVDDDVDAPTAAFDHPRVSPQTDGDATDLTWGYSPDVSAAVLTVTRDGVILFSGPAPTDGSFDYGNTLGNYAATLTVTDDDADRSGDSLNTTVTTSWTVVDDDVDAPTVAFDEPRLDTLLDSSATPLTWGFSPDVTRATLTVNHDGTTIFNGPAPASGSFTYGNALGTYTATLTVTDNDADRPGDSQSASTSKSWTVVDDDVTAPTVLLLNTPAGDEVTVDQPRQFEWGMNDGQSDLPIAAVRITRGTEVIFQGSEPGGRFDLTPYGIGTFTITVTATDRDNDRPNDALSTTTSKTLRVVAVQAPPPPTTSAGLEDDPTAPGKKMLVVRGTEGSDHILVSRSLAVKVNGENEGSFAGTAVSRVVVHALGGNDFVWMADYYTGAGDSDSCVFGRLNVPTFIYGGAGCDLLVTGNAGGVVVGGADNDLIVGGAGRDVTIGGEGADLMVSLANDDILVAGFTSHDRNDTALAGIFKEWNRVDRGYLDRVRALKGETSGLNGQYTLRTDGTAQNVFDDGEADEVDLLVGGDGNDWYLFNTGADGGAKDVILGSTSSTEVKSDIDAN